MNPTFCTYRGNPLLSDAYFSSVAEASGMGKRRPGLALRFDDEKVDVMVAADGRVERIQRAHVDTSVAMDVVLAMMEAVEEAIEDAIDGGSTSAPLLERLQATLNLMERTFGEE